VDEVQLAVAGGVTVAGRTRPREAHDVATGKGGDHSEIRALLSPVRPQFGESLGRHILESGGADEVVVGLVPACGVHAAQGLRIHVSNGTDDDVGLEFGFHGVTLRPGPTNTKSAIAGSIRGGGAVESTQRISR